MKRRKRFAVVIGVAAAGVMALGARTVTAQTGAQPPAVVKYDTKLTITHEACCTGRGALWHGGVLSDRDLNPGWDPANAVRECMGGRRVILFQERPGADRKLGNDRNQFRPPAEQDPTFSGQRWWTWGVVAPVDGRVYARVTPKVGDGFVCRADRSRTIVCRRPPPGEDCLPEAAGPRK